MKISAINNYNNNRIKNIQNTSTIPNKTSNVKVFLSTAYPSNYYISFGAMGVDAAFGEFKDTEMPTTVRDYIENQEYVLSDADFRALKAKGLKRIQRKAFANLADCKTIDDIKAKFPNEEDFKNLKSLSEIKTKSEFFSLMKNLEQQGIKTLSCDEDVTTFLVKQVYYEAETYKKVIEKLASVITPEAAEQGLKAKLSEYTIARGTFFLPLGLKVPNGQTYGRELKNSDPLNSRVGQRYFVDLTPEQVNERIQKLLLHTEKSKYSMMDAWNHCEQAREDLSKFLTKNINNPKYSLSVLSSDINIYDAKFYTKMSRLMKDFWTLHPEHKESLGREIKVALERFDKYKNIGGDDFETYKKEIESRSQKIRENIQFNKIDVEIEYPHAIIMLNKITKAANPLLIKTEQTHKDFSRMVFENMSVSEFEILDGSPNRKEYKELFPEGIKSKMRTLIKTPEYTNLANALYHAVLRELIADNIIEEKELARLISSGESIDIFLKKILNSVDGNYKLDVDNVDSRYNKYKTHLTGENAEKIRAELLKYNLDFKEEDSLKLDVLLSTQGNYLKDVLSDGMLSELTQIAFWNEFDRLYETNYSDFVTTNIHYDKLLDEAICIVDEMDFSVVDDLNW